MAESAAAPQSKDVGSVVGGQSTKVMRFSFRSLMKPDAMEFLINARSGSKNPSTLTSTTAGCSNKRCSGGSEKGRQSGVSAMGSS